MYSSYLEQVMEDVKQYIEWEIDLKDWKGNREGLEEFLNERLWVEDSVTGNASGSYTFNRYKAMQFVTENLDDLNEMCREFGVDEAEIGRRLLNGDWEWMDVSIRCCYLCAAIGQVLDELEDKLEEENEDGTQN